MGEHQFKIDFVVNAEQAKQAKAEEVQGYKAVESAAVQAARKAIQASNQQAQAAKQNVAQILTAQQVAAKAREELIARENKRAIQAAADQADAHKQAEKAKLDAARATADAQKKASEDAKRQAREAAEAQKAAARQVVESQKAAAAAAKESAKQVAAAQRQAADEMARMGSIGKNVVGIVTNVVGALGGVTSVIGGITAVAESFKAAREQAYAAAQMAIDYRDALKEIASLKGQPTPNAGILAGEIRIREKTFQNANDSAATQSAALGAAASVLDAPGFTGKMSEADFTRGVETAGMLQSIKGGDARSYGALAGAVASFDSAKRLSGEDLRRKVIGQQRVGDLGKFTPDQFNNELARAGSMAQSGDFSSLEDVGAYLSAFSTVGPDRAGTNLQRFVKVTKGSLLDGTVNATDGAIMSKRDYLASLGASDQMTSAQIGDLIGGDFQKAQEAAAKAGRNFSLETYATQRGYSNQEERQTLKDFMQIRGQLNDRFLPLARTAVSGEEADKYLNALKASPTGVALQANLAKDKADLALGAGPSEYAEKFREQTFHELRARDKDSWNPMAFKGDYKANRDGWFSGPALDKEVIERLRRSGVAAGLDWNPRTIDGPDGQTIIDPLSPAMNASRGTQDQSDQIMRLITDVMQAGGNPMATPQLDQTTRAQLAVAERTEKLMQKLVDQSAKPKVLAVQPGAAMPGLAP